MEKKKHEYIMDWRKQNKKQIAIDLNLEEAEELNKLCKEKKVTKAEVLRKGIEWLKSVK